MPTPLIRWVCLLCEAKRSLPSTQSPGTMCRCMLPVLSIRESKAGTDSDVFSVRTSPVDAEDVVAHAVATFGGSAVLWRLRPGVQVIAWVPPLGPTSVLGVKAAAYRKTNTEGLIQGVYATSSLPAVGSAFMGGAVKMLGILEPCARAAETGDWWTERHRSCTGWHSLSAGEVAVCACTCHRAGAGAEPVPLMGTSLGNAGS